MFAGVLQFRLGDAQRIAGAVHYYEHLVRPSNPSSLPRAVGGGKPTRIGKVTADWAFGTCATVTIWESGTNCTPDANSPTETIEDVRNLSMNVAADSWVAISRAANGYWYLVEAGLDPAYPPDYPDPPGSSCSRTIGGEDITKWPGWDGTKVQLLGHDANGCLAWFDTNDCETTTPSPGGGG